MAKVLARTGVSLADVYNILGSIVGVDQLNVEEIQGVHEMGGTIFSERLTGVIGQIRAFEIAQSTDFAVALPILSGLLRVLGIVVVADAAARVTNVQVSFSDTIGGNEQDFPAFAWATAIDAERAILMQIDGAVAATAIQFVPLGVPQVPSLIVGTEHRANNVPTILMRGQTAAFGAGDVTINAFIYLASAADQALSSFGVPIPGW